MHEFTGAYDLTVVWSPDSGTYEVTAQELLPSGAFGPHVTTSRGGTLTLALLRVGRSIELYDTAVRYWYDCHSDEAEGAHLDLLTADLMCQCCGVDYSGQERDLLSQ